MGEYNEYTPFIKPDPLTELMKRAQIQSVVNDVVSSPIPTDAAARKKTPVWSGFIKYFPRAIVKISQVSQAGNDQHNPGQPLHWAKEKSRDHFDTAIRHLIDHIFDPVDIDGQLHLAKAGWRIMAALETYLEEQHAGK